jgi:hypothetical protein
MFISNLQISYSNDEEYRQCMREIVGMNVETMKSKFDGLDDVSRDELLFDNDAAIKYLDFIYDETHKNSLFSEIYKIAAGFMLSTDQSFGVSVLFSYDYLDLFYKCLNEYFKNKAAFSGENVAYVKLLAKLKR